MNSPVASVGDHLRQWRQRRRKSQLELAVDAEISSRHLSFVETGRSQPSREMVLHLAEQLDIPMRERNVLLVAAGYAPIFPTRAMDDAELDIVRRAVDLFLQAQLPYPAFAIDRHWAMQASNGALPGLYAGVAPELLQPPINLLRLSLHPAGTAPLITNLAQWRGHLLHRLKRQIEQTADPVLIDLLQEVSAYPFDGPDNSAMTSVDGNAIFIPLQINTPAGRLSFFSTTTVFGTPIDVTVSELALELFFPADAATATLVQKLSSAGA
jgi:transcriptional regulator with XRE-family HTH domain